MLRAGATDGLLAPLIRDGKSVQSNRIDTYVSHRAGVNVSAGQQAVVSGGTEQTLCGPYDGPGEAGIIPRGHG